MYIWRQPGITLGTSVMAGADPFGFGQLDDRQYDFPLGRPDNAFYQILVLIIPVLILTHPPDSWNQGSFGIRHRKLQ